MIKEFFLIGLFYLIGAVPTAYLVGKITRGKDLRILGSGNIGATNAFRVLGKKAGFFVLLFDFLKGFIPVLAARGFYDQDLTFIFLAAAPVLGHVFTPFLRFKGGKGVATGAGVLLALGADLFIFSLIVWGVLFFNYRIVSVGSLVSSALLPIWSWYRGYPREEILLLIVLSGLIFWTHRANLERLINRRENTFR